MSVHLTRRDIFLITLLITGYCLWMFLMHLYDVRYKKDFQVFYSNTLKGKIVRLEPAHRDVFRLDNSNVEYRFASRMVWYNQRESTFSGAADKGDSVYKPAWSDTLYLKKTDGRTYKFTFEKLK